MAESNLSRRQAFAELLLHGNPIRLDAVEPRDRPGELTVDLEDMAALHHYRDRFVPDAEIHVLPKPVNLLAYASGQWAGWQLSLDVPVRHRPPADELTVDTREQLQRLVDQPAGAAPAGDREATS